MNVNNNNCKVRDLSNNKRQKLKKKNNQNRIIFIGAGSFLAFFLIFMAAASMMSPKLPNISSQSPIDESSLTQMSSDDFKGRVDPSLKQIEKEETSSGYSSSSTPTTSTVSKTASTITPTITTTQTTATEVTQEQQIINDSNTTEASMPADATVNEIPVKKVEIKRSIQTPNVQPAPPRPIITRPVAPLVLRDRIRPVSVDNEQ